MLTSVSRVKPDKDTCKMANKLIQPTGNQVGTVSNSARGPAADCGVGLLSLQFQNPKIGKRGNPDGNVKACSSF